MTTTGRGDTPYLPLAFSIHSTPGAYAVLAGAGISRGADVPTAWEVMTELVIRVCRTREGEEAANELDADSVDPWWQKAFGTPLTYSGLLGELTATRGDRESLLRPFFEIAGQAPRTSNAHRAIARLVAAGHVRVIVTMNFDHLFETALEEYGVVPTIVRTDADAAALAPLHTITCVVIHLHGDYRYGGSMLNTATELKKGYEPRMAALLTRVLGDHALLTVGWSVLHDHALRDTVERHICRHYRSAWIDPNPTRQARDVAALIKAQVLEATADDALVRVADLVDALDRRRLQHPVTSAVAGDRVKKDLGGQHPPITAHDTIMTAYAHAAETVESFAQEPPVDVDDAAQKIAASAEPLCAATAALAYWGSGTTDRWWITPILDHAQSWRPIMGVYNTLWPELPWILASHVFYAGGVAAVAAGRYDLLGQIFNEQVDRGNGAVSASRALTWTFNRFEQSAVARARVAEIVADTLSLTPQHVDRAWQEFEVLQLLHRLVTTRFAENAIAAAAELSAELMQARRVATPMDTQSQEMSHRVRNLRDREREAARHVERVTGMRLFVRSEVADRTGQLAYVCPAAVRLRRSAGVISAVQNWPGVRPNPYTTSAIRCVEAAIDMSADVGSGLAAGASEGWLDDGAGES